MTDDRMTQLFDEARATGNVPAGATPEERSEVEAMLRAARLLDDAARNVDGEMQSAMPVARARFERFLAAQQQPADAPPVREAHRRHGIGAWLAGRRSFVALASGLAAVAILFVAAFAASEVFFSSTQSAYASELEPGDYVQLEGVVTSVRDGEDPRVAVQSQFGTIDVDLTSETSIVDEDEPAGVSAIAPGRRVVVSGLVDRERRIRAGTLALSVGDLPPPTREHFERPLDLPGAVEATILWLAQPEDGRPAKVAVETRDGRRLVLSIDAESIAELLRRHASGPGVGVELFHPQDAPPGVFALRLDGPPPQPDAGLHCGQHVDRHRLLNICGVLVERSPERLRILTRDGLVDIGFRPDTRLILAPDSGLSLADLRGPEGGVGHFVAILGGPARDGEGLIADIIVVGGEAPRLD